MAEPSGVERSPKVAAELGVVDDPGFGELVEGVAELFELRFHEADEGECGAAGRGKTCRVAGRFVDRVDELRGW